MTEQLKPCPFCGTSDLLGFEPSHEGGWTIVKCRKCGCSGSTGRSTSEWEAIAWWNRRAAIAQQPAPAVPDGWRLVPVEPTEEMLDAGLDRHLPQTMSSARLALLYRAMLTGVSAAPVAVQEPVAHRLINCLGEVITEWRDGPPPERITSACGVEQTDVSIELAYAALPAAEQPKDVNVLRELVDALEGMLAIHDESSGFKGKYGRALDEAIAAQKVKIDQRIAAARAAIDAAKGRRK